MVIFCVMCSLLVLMTAEAREDERRTVQTSWTVDGDFSLAPFDTGVLQDRCDSLTPWGSGSWGAEYATFRGSFNSGLTAARFRCSGEDAYLYGKNLQPGRAWGYVRYVQGDVWGGGACGQRSHYLPVPEPLRGRRVIVELDCLLDTARLLTPQDSWILVAVNLWLSGPSLPPGKDRLGRKPVVFDLYIHQQANMLEPPVAHESEAAFHVPVRLQPLEKGRWCGWRVDVTEQLNAALERTFRNSERAPGMRLEDLTLYQVDFVLELVNAEAAATIDNFRILLPVTGSSYIPSEIRSGSLQ